METTANTFTKTYKYVIKDTSFTNTTAKHVYLEILSMQESGNKVFYSYDGLGSETGYSGKTVQRAVALLIETGKITIERRDGGTHLYTANDWFKEESNEEPKTKCPTTQDKMSTVPKTECPTPQDKMSYDKTNYNTNPIISPKRLSNDAEEKSCTKIGQPIDDMLETMFIKNVTSSRSQSYSTVYKHESEDESLY